MVDMCERTLKIDKDKMEDVLLTIDNLTRFGAQITYEIIEEKAAVNLVRVRAPNAELIQIQESLFEEVDWRMGWDEYPIWLVSGRLD